MQLVIDTNVLVSSLLQPLGPPGRILDLILLGELTPVFDDRIIIEYQHVLARPRFGFHPDDVASILDYFRISGLHLTVPPLQVVLPDPDDLAFLEVAFAAQAPLITGNQRHFPNQIVEPLQVLILSPTVFLETIDQI